jgi:hypothetical protein
LVKAGWTVTHAPYTLTFGQRDVFVDFGAERLLLAAERGQEKIAVELKTFRGQSDVSDLEAALGQYVFYRSLLMRAEPERRLFLAVPDTVFTSTLQEPISRLVLEDLAVAVIAFNVQREEIVRWTP